MSNMKECGFLRIDGRKTLPLFRQIYDQIRTAILQGELKTGDRVPSSRELVHRLGISRTTVVTALDMLISEGYLATRHGSGTFVASDVPDQPVSLKPATGDDSNLPIHHHENLLSEFGDSLRACNRHLWYEGRPAPLCPGEPALDLFPTKIWSKIVRRVWKSIAPSDLSYGEPAGYAPLRNQIAEYLRSHRGVNCDASQVVIVSGTQQAIDVVARIALEPGDKVLFENPGYLSAASAFENQRAELIALPVDDLGAAIRQVSKQDQDAKLVYVTPSHQYPLGVTMSIERRLELIDWAQRNDVLILEDDYDSEYRYGQKPLPCLQGLGNDSRTVYVGSFSKVICPAIGIGYAIVPPWMIAPVENALRLISRPPSQTEQIVVSEFIREGHFVRHIRRMRKSHALRQACLVDALDKKVSPWCQVIGNSAGLHCTLTLKGRNPKDTYLVERLLKQGVITRPLSNYYLPDTLPKGRLNGLILGFASSTESQIRRAVTKIQRVLEKK